MSAGRWRWGAPEGALPKWRRKNAFEFPIRVARYEKGGRVWWVEYGIGGKGGSDYIGYKRVTITQELVGQVMPIFCAVETKAARGRVMPEQQDFLDQVSRDGGIAVVARGPEDLP